MTRKAVQILPRHDLSVTEVDHLEDRLYNHNRRATGRHDGRRLAFVALDERGKQIGAIAGYTRAGMAEIKQLWVDEDHRGCGLGRGLLEAAIAEAIDRRFQAVWALSYEFQAPGLYAGRRVEGLPARPQPHRALLSAHWPMTALVVKEHNDA